MQAGDEQNAFEGCSTSPLTQAFEKAKKELEDAGIAPSRKQLDETSSEKHIAAEDPVSEESAPLTQAFEKAKKELEEEGISPSRKELSPTSSEKHIAVEQKAEKKAPISDKAVSVATDEPMVISRPDPAARAAESAGNAAGRKIGKFLAPK